MKIDDKTKKTLLQSKTLEAEVKKKGEDLKKLKEINHNLSNDKNPPLIINSIVNSENLDKIEQIFNINKKKVLKPVEHPILLNNKNINEKNREPTDLKLNLKLGNSKIINQEEKLGVIKIKKIDSNPYKIDNEPITTEERSINNKDSDIIKISPKKTSGLNSYDINSLKNIDLQENQFPNDSFVANENENKNNIINTLMNFSDQNFNTLNNTNKTKWRFDKNLLDDSEFRKTRIIKEKLEIEYIPEKPINNIHLKNIINNKKSDKSTKNIGNLNADDSENRIIHKKVNSMIFIDYKEQESGIKDCVIEDVNKDENNNINEEPEPSNILDETEILKIKSFLNEMNLEKHLETFIDNGYNDLNKIIADITDEKLKDLLIPYGHRIKILKKIKEIKNENINKKTIIKDLIKNEEKPTTNFKYDELPDEAGNQMTVMNMSHYSKISEVKNLNTSIKTIDLNNKDNNPNFEETQKRKFHQAVIDFVNENRPIHDKNVEKIIYINEEYENEIKQNLKNKIKKEKTKTNNDLSSNNKIGSKNISKPPVHNVVQEDKPSKNSSKSTTERNTEIIAEDTKKATYPVETNEIFIQSDVKISYTDIAELIKQDPEKIFLPLTKYKNSCFNCFKVFLINKGFESSGKPFCSIPCKQEFQDKYNVVCEIEICKRPIYKGLSIFENSKYYCSQNCFRKSEDYLKFSKSMENNNKTQSLADKNNENHEQSIEIEYDPMEDF